MGLLLYKAIPQQGDLMLSGPPSGQGASGGAQICNRSVIVDLRADPLTTEPPTLPLYIRRESLRNIIKMLLERKRNKGKECTTLKFTEKDMNREPKP
ncbi:hypothetical protein PoB_006514100 [Plakobranchus ocellatus]|uniref:Uncharacterized protein n=1 Tax=Plakobranchus ocellatus TaxID=259542 RepID=A0AAV4D372_9GAST|nr:hypothetical protein PoB_006514100 [Plakobranchus ocellatus]